MDAHGTEDPEETKDPEPGHTAQEVEDAAPVTEVPALRRRREEPIGEVREEDESQRDVDVDDEPPGLRLIRDRKLEDEVHDRENRDREDEELVGRALQILAWDGAGDHGA